MKKEAIERTKARCKKEIRGKDRIYVLPWLYISKDGMKEDSHIDTSKDALSALIVTLILFSPIVLSIIAGIFLS